MAVNLSPVGGVAAQFFTNSGAVLTGGKIFTYAAGTTTPQAAYTSSQGNVAWTNPIVLDAAGRVPSGGEIWLTDGLIYKFILKDANDVLIATYDNISGINSNFVAYSNSQEIQTATAGQTVFTLTTMQYQVGTNSLSVFVDGVNQYGPGAQYSYVETDSTTVTFNAGLHVGAEVKFTTTQQQGAGAVDASQVSYDPPFTGSVVTNVEAKLAQVVNVVDFGADPTGVADSTTAIQKAIDYGFTNSTQYKKIEIQIPSGSYRITDSLLYGTGVGHVLNQAPNITGLGYVEIKYDGPINKAAFYAGAPGNGLVLYSKIENISFEFDGAATTGTTGVLAQAAHYVSWEGVSSIGFETGIDNRGSIGCTFDFKRKSVAAIFQCINIIEEPDGIIGLRSNVSSYKNARLSGSTGQATGINGDQYGGAVLFENIVFEGGLDLGFQLNRGGEVSQEPIRWDMTTFRNCWFEAINLYAGTIENASVEMYDCFMANNLKILKKDADSRIYFRGTSNYNGNFIEAASQAHASNVYFEHVGWGNYPTNQYPQYQILGSHSPYVDRQTLMVRYAATYPPGNNNQNWGLTIDLDAEIDKVFGTNWQLAKVLFSGSDGLTSYFMELIVRRGAAAMVMYTNAPGAAYTLSGLNLTFNNDGTGGWFVMNANYTLTYSNPIGVY